MRNATLATGLVAIALAAACQTSPRIDVPEARRAHKVEIQLDGDGSMLEVEYHVSPDQVPAAVREAMDSLPPGGAFTDAEREVHDGELLFELSRTVDGLEVEAMFFASGRLHSEELEVRADAVPAEVRSAVDQRFPDGIVDKYEEIRDGSRQLREYHVKVDVDGRRHKLILSTSGKVTGDYLELQAELEVPAGG
jgi:Putative beta-lactamase-inhibitor-like, PepSY-like